MKLRIIEDIATTCCEFTDQVCPQQAVIKRDELIKKIEDICNNYDIVDEDTISVDYKCMNFIFHKTTLKEDYWVLCENASYYIFDKNRDWKDTIDVEL